MEALNILVIDDMMDRIEKFKHNIPSAHNVTSVLDTAKPEDINYNCRIIINVFKYGKELLERGGWDVVYLDHYFATEQDLADEDSEAPENTQTGMDLLKLMVERQVPEPIKGLLVHTASPCAGESMVKLARRHLTVPAHWLNFPWERKGCDLHKLLCT